MGCCPPVRHSDDRAVVAATIRVHALVLVEIRPTADVLVVACHRSTVVVPVPADDLSGATAPLGTLTGLVSLLEWRLPPLSPVLALSLRDGLSS